MGLTLKSIAKLLKTPGRHFDANGLYLQVPEPGQIQPRTHRASWILRYELNGRERWMGLGKVADFELEEARERARKARQLLADGIDPIAARETNRRAQEEQTRKAAAIPTFKEAAERYFKAHGDKWRNAKHRAQFLSTLKAYAFPKLGALQVIDITTEDVRLAIEPIWRKVPETANRTRGRVESVLSWSIANRYREGPNPARWADNLEHLLPARGLITTTNHHAALPYANLPEFWAELNARDGVAARALEFTILTAARTGETIGAQWGEIDLIAKIWTVPADRIKGGKEHRVPLSVSALDILRTLPTEHGNDYVFIGPRQDGLSNMAMASVLKRLGRNNITVHGFRSTFRDWAAERTATPNHVVEMALAHVIGDKVEAAYRRGDLFEKRRKLMVDWAKFCTTKSANATENVVPIRRASNE